MSSVTESLTYAKYVKCIYPLFIYVFDSLNVEVLKLDCTKSCRFLIISLEM